MKVIEFGSSRVKIYSNGKLIKYYPFNLMSLNYTEILLKIDNLIKEEGTPNYSFFTEWARNNKLIKRYIESHKNLGEAIIISSLEEAKYFYLAVKNCFNISSIIMDSGGGSVQICISEKTLMSYKIGSIFIENNIIRHGIPYTVEETEIIRNYIRQEIGNSLKSFSNNNLIVGSTKVKSFFSKMFHNSLNKNDFIDMSTLSKGINRLMFKSYDEIHHIFPESEGYMYGTLILLITIEEIAKMVNAKNIYPTNINWLQYFFKSKSATNEANF